MAEISVTNQCSKLYVVCAPPQVQSRSFPLSPLALEIFAKFAKFKGCTLHPMTLLGTLLPNLRAL